MTRNDWLAMLVAKGVRYEIWCKRNFHERTLIQWLEDHEHLLVNGPCHMCTKSKFFSTEKCAENVGGGGTCYEEILRSVFLPFVQEAVAGTFSQVPDHVTIIHRKGDQWDGMVDMRLLDIIDHELGGACQRWQVALRRERDEQT